MTRQYTWQLNVRSYETDAWRMVPTSGILRYLEQSAVAAAADAGYGGEFHREHNSAWVIRRLTLLMEEPIRQAGELQISTWLSHISKVRGGREYVIRNAATGRVLYTGVAEWVYINRETLKPILIPPALAEEFDVPGAPLGNYDAPLDVGAPLQPIREFTAERTAEWHEADSMRHVNNANYADWLDDAVRAAIAEMGWSVDTLNQQGLHLRGEYYNLDYKRAALPGDRLRITTQIESISGRLFALHQSVTGAEGREVLTSNSVYGWRNNEGEIADPPQTWNAPS